MNTKQPSDAPIDRSAGDADTKRSDDDALDEALDETFPASDPISPASPRPAKPGDDTCK